VACDNIPTPHEARLTASTATPISQPTVSRRAAGKGFEEQQVARFEDELASGLLGSREDRVQARAGASRRGGTGRWITSPAKTTRSPGWSSR
jgi:hypothetical protein